MAPPNNNNAPQPTNPALKTEDSLVHKIAETILGGNLKSGKATLLGQAPPGLESRFAPVPVGQYPEFYKLPSPRERCPYSGGSRSWLLDMEKLGLIKIVRVRQPGRVRGANFVYLPSLLALLRAQLEEGK